MSWEERRYDRAGIVVPYYVRADGIIVRFSSERGGWCAFSADGDRLHDIGDGFTAGAMTDKVDQTIPFYEAVEQRPVSMMTDNQGRFVVLTDRGRIYRLFETEWRELLLPPLPNLQD